jgi:NAD-dependent DNA ligase
MPAAYWHQPFPEMSSVVSAVEPVSRWYIQDAFQQVWGPYTNQELELELTRGDALVAAQGMDTWVMASDLFRGRRISDVAQALALDPDGRPRNRAYNQRRRADRAVNEMLGLVRGVIADGRVSDEEVESLRYWLAENEDVAHIWPISVLAERVQRIFRDGVVDDLERAELHQVLQQTTGAGPGIPEPGARPTRLPLCAPAPDLSFPGTVFVFTGAFAYGTRRDCEDATVSRGGLVRSAVTRDARVVVIGAIGNGDWAHSSHGRKIEKAVEYRTKGVPLSIVSEEHWTRFLT